MPSYVRNENASKSVKESQTGKIIKSLLKGSLNQLSQAHEKLADELERIAEKESGILDEDEMTVTFGTTEESIVVYASLNADDSPVYQALLRQSKPTIFIAGFPQSMFYLALESLQSKVTIKGIENA